MKHRFHKDELPFLDRTFSPEASPRDYYWLARRIHDGEHFTPNRELEILAYEEAAHRGDDWAMHELYEYLKKDPKRFPEALSWLYKSIRSGNQGPVNAMVRDWGDIYAGIMNYRNTDVEPYANVELKCAMLTVMLLLGFGRDRWEWLDAKTKAERIQDLTHNACKVLRIDDVLIEVSPTQRNFPDSPGVDGLAFMGRNKIWIKTSSMDNYERLVVVLFHELGHHVVHAMTYSPEPKKSELFHLYGLTPERIGQWERQDKGYAITLTEEDPDTLSYGTWMTYRLLFPLGK